MAPMPSSKQDSFRLFLRKVPVFSGLEGRSLESVIAVLKKHVVPTGAFLCTEGELGRTMYVVHKGEVEVFRTNSLGEPVCIVKLGPGECFGEMALVELEPRSATVVTTRPSTLLSLNNLDLYRLFKEDNYAFVIVLQNICRLLSRRLRKADSRIADFLSGKASKPTKPTQTARGKRAAAPRARRRAG